MTLPFWVLKATAYASIGLIWLGFWAAFGPPLARWVKRR